MERAHDGHWIANAMMPGYGGGYLKFIHYYDYSKRDAEQLAYRAFNGMDA